MLCYLMQWNYHTALLGDAIPCKPHCLTSVPCTPSATTGSGAVAENIQMNDQTQTRAHGLPALLSAKPALAMPGALRPLVSSWGCSSGKAAVVKFLDTSTL